MTKPSDIDARNIAASRVELKPDPILDEPLQLYEIVNILRHLTDYPDNLPGRLARELLAIRRAVSYRIADGKLKYISVNHADVEYAMIAASRIHSVALVGCHLDVLTIGSSSVGELVGLGFERPRGSVLEPEYVKEFESSNNIVNGRRIGDQSK